jgi:imidazolonepropionase-like amidohydrolase
VKRIRALLIAALLLTAICRSASPDRIAIRARRLLDPAAGRYIADAVVYLDGDRITRVTSGGAVARGYRVIEVETLLPGLIDAHTHLAWAGAPGDDPARATLRAGFTTVRNLGSNGTEDQQLRALADAPRVFLSGPGLGPKGGVFHQTFGDGAIVERADDGAEKVRAQIRDLHVDLIKVCAGGGVVASPRDADATELDAETLAAIVSEAHSWGLKVAAHAQGANAIRNAVNAGVDSIEHGGGIDRETAVLMRERQIALVPTLARLTSRLEAAKAQGAAADVIERIEANRERILTNIRAAIAAGVTIVNGSDATVLPHGRNAEELQALVSVGLTPLEAIRAATTRAAALIGRKDLGCVTAGCAADLVAVDGDPLADVGALLKPRTVIARGRIVQ